MVSIEEAIKAVIENSEKISSEIYLPIESCRKCDFVPRCFFSYKYASFQTIGNGWLCH